jgi:hypothetical protein
MARRGEEGKKGEKREGKEEILTQKYLCKGIGPCDDMEDRASGLGDNQPTPSTKSFT